VKALGAYFVATGGNTTWQYCRGSGKTGRAGGGAGSGTGAFWCGNGCSGLAHWQGPLVCRLAWAILQLLMVK